LNRKAVLQESGKSRLVYVDDSAPGISRRRAGRGWCYRDHAGQRIADRAEIDRLNAVALPPAYRDAWFCPMPHGHILATGIDARGRKQYRYHPDFRAAREAEKFDGCAAFGALLPKIRARVEAALAGRGLSEERCIASVVRLLDTGAIRVGNEAYARANASFGATTLRMKHVELRGQSLRLRFRAKSGVERDMRLTDRALVRFVRRMQDLPGQHLFQYLGEDGAPCPVGSADINAWLRSVTGAEFTAKHFRTWHASVLAFGVLAHAEQNVPLKELLGQVSDRLGNTPTIARKSYIHPAVLALVPDQAEWRAGLRLPRATQWLSRDERGLLALLDAQPSVVSVGTSASK